MTGSNALLALAVAVLAGSGCASLGYFDNGEFVDALTAHPKQCRAAYAMLAKPFGSRLDEMTHRGIWELSCGDRAKGQEYLSLSASSGDSYAKRMLVRYGLPLPEPMLPAVGSGSTSIDVYIHK